MTAPQTPAPEQPANNQPAQQQPQQPSWMSEAYGRYRTPYYYGPREIQGPGLRVGPENYRVSEQWMRRPEVQQILRSRQVQTYQWKPGENQVEDVAFSRPEQTFWQNPQRVARYRNMVRNMPPGWEPPEWMPTKEIDAAYEYLKFRNDEKPWQDWQALPDNDPGADFLKNLPQPPNEFLMPDEQSYAAPVPTQQQIDAQKPFGSWDELSPWQQMQLSVFSPQPGMADRPEWTRATAAVGQGILAGLAGAAVGGAVGGVPGAAIGFLGVAGGSAYQAFTGQEVPGLGPMLYLFNVPAMEAERLYAYGQTASQAGWRGGLGELLKNYPKYRAATSWGYEAGLTPFGENIIDEINIAGMKLPGTGQIFSGAIDLAHAIGLSEQGGGYTGPAADNQVWRLSEGYATPQDLTGAEGAAAIEEYVRRMEAGEARESLDAEFYQRFGDTGFINDFIAQSIIDPLNLAPFIEGRAGQAVAKIARQDRLAAAFKASTGNPLIDIMPMGVQQLASWLTGIKASDGLMGAMNTYKSWIQRGYFPEGTKITPASQLSRFDKVLGGLTGEGLIAELQPRTAGGGIIGWVRTLTSLTPASQAHVMETAAHDNINVLLSLARQDPETMIRMLHQAGGADPVRAGDLGEAVLNSPMTATISAAIKDALSDGFDVNMLNDWVQTETQRTLLNTVAQQLGTTPGKLLEQMTDNPDVTAQRINQVAPTAGTPDQIKAMFKPFLGEEPAPWNPEMFQAQLALHLFDHMDEWLAKRFDLKPDHALFRLSQTLKGMQSLLLLGINPAYFINNAVNNAVTRGAVGCFGYMTPRQIDGFMKRFGIVPERLRVGLDPTSDGKITSLHQNAAMHKGDWIDKVQGAVDGVNQKLGIFSRFSAANERLEGGNAYTIGMSRFWKKNWKEGVGFRRMDPRVEAMLDAMAPGIKEAVYAAVRAGMNMDEVEARLLGDYIQPNLNQVVEDAARKVYPDAPELGAQIIQEMGIIPEMERALAGASTPEEVNAAFNRVEQRLQDFVDEAATRDLVHRAAEVRAQVQAETQVDGVGFAPALGIYTDLQVKIAARWLHHFGEWQDLYNRRDTMSREEFDGHVRTQMANDSREWARINTFELQTHAGIIQALGMESETSRQFISLLTEAHENWRRFYDGWDETRPDGTTLHHDGRNEKLKKFFAGMKRKRGESDADYGKRYDIGWRRLQAELADDYRQATANENRLQRAMDERFAATFEERTQRPAPEALAWREEVQAIRMQMQEAMQEFRRRAVEMTPEERRAAWTEFVRGYNQMIVELKRTEIEGAWRLAQQEPSGTPSAGAMEALETAAAQPVPGPQPAGAAEVNAALAGSERPAPTQQLQANLAEAMRAGITNRAGAPIEAYTLNIVNAYMRSPEGAAEPRPPQPAQPTRGGLERWYGRLEDVPTDLVTRALAHHATPEASIMAQATAGEVLNANDILRMADKAQREAAIHAAGMMARRHIREKLKVFNQAEEINEAVLFLMDKHAEAMARRQGRTPTDADLDAWYATHVANIIDSNERGQLHQQAAAQAWYYSQLQRTIETMPPKMTPQALQGFLKGKVKTDELRWTGFDEWLAEKQAAGQQVTKQEVNEFLRMNQVRIDEVILGGEGGRSDLPGWAEAEKSLAEYGWRVEYNPEDQTVIAFARLDDEYGDFVTADEVDGRAGDYAFELEQLNRAYATGAAYTMTPEFDSRVGYLHTLGWDVITRMDDPDQAEVLHFYKVGEHPEEGLADPTASDIFTENDLEWLRTHWYTSRYGTVEAWHTMNAIAELAAQPNAAMPTKFDAYKEPGGKGYRELLLRWEVPFDEDAVRRQYNEENPGLDDGWETLNESSRENYIDKYKAENGIEDFQSAHWDQKNVLAHVRFDERTGPNGERVLFIEEIQSDWHEQGRKKGYQGQDPALVEQANQLGTQLAALVRDANIARNEMRNARMRGQGYAEARRRAIAAERAVEETNARLQEIDSELAGGVPSAPFSKTWPELIMKRMIRWAAESGYDRVEWANGKMNADRYSLSNYIDELTWEKRGEQVYLTGQKEGRRAFGQQVTDRDLADYVGVEVARQIREGDTTGRLEGIDLAVGGMGMRKFYDEMIPSLVGKYIKKWGAAVDTTGMPGGAKYEFTFRKNTDYQGEGYDIISPATGDVVDQVETIEEAQQWLDQRQIRLEPDLYAVTIKDNLGKDEFAMWNMTEEEARMEAESYVDSNVVRQSDLGKNEDQVQGFNVTPAMREAALTGQPLFQRGSQIKPTEPGNLLYQRGMSTEEVVGRIEDAGWVDPATVAAVFNNTAGPHLREVTAFIASQRQKYVSGRMTPRDIAKAYILTASSIGSDGKTIDTAVRTFLENGIQFTRDGQAIDLGFYSYRHPSTGEWYIRPEELTAAWLMSDMGKRALDDLEIGRTELFKKFVRARRKVYGRFEETILETRPSKKGALNFDDIDEITRLINEAEGDPDAVGEVVGRLAGISAGKTGFVKHLLGFGDETTLDIQEINFWTGRMVDEDAAQLIRDRWGKNPEVSNAIKRRIEETFYKLRQDYGIGEDLPEEAFVHVMHHWLLDAQKQTQTTHQGMYRAMNLAQEAHGAIEYLDDGRAIIKAMKAPNVTTMVHEIGHIFVNDLTNPDLDIIAKWTGIADADEYRLLQQRFRMGDWTWREYTGLRELVQAGRADATAVARFNELDQNQTVKDFKRLEAAEEKWARGFEEYIFKGDAPTPELRSVFRKFSDWILSIYTRLRRSMGKIIGFDQQYEFAGVNIDETVAGVRIRDIYDRLFTEEASRPWSLDDMIKDRLERIKKDRRYTNYTSREQHQMAQAQALAELLRGDPDAATARQRAEKMIDDGAIHRTTTGQEIDPIAIWDAARLAEENPAQAPWSPLAVKFGEGTGEPKLSARERAVLHGQVSRLPNNVQQAIRATAQYMLDDIRAGGTVRIGEGEEGTIAREGNAPWYWEWYDSAGKPAGFKRTMRTALEKIIAGSEDANRPMVRQVKNQILSWLTGEVPTDQGYIADAGLLWYLGRKDQLFQTFEQQLDTATPDWLAERFGPDADQVIGEYVQWLDRPQPEAAEPAPTLIERMAEATQAEANAQATFESGKAIPVQMAEGMQLAPGEELPRPLGTEEAIKRGLGEAASEYADDLIAWVELGEKNTEPDAPGWIPPATAKTVRKRVQDKAGTLREFARMRRGSPINAADPGPGLQLKRAHAFTHGDQTIAGIVYRDGTPVAYLPENGEILKPFRDDGARLLGLDPEDPASWVVMRGDEILSVNPDDPQLPDMPKPERTAARPAVEDENTPPQKASAVDLYGEGGEIRARSPEQRMKERPPRARLYQAIAEYRQLSLLDYQAEPAAAPREHAWTTRLKEINQVTKELEVGSAYITRNGEIVMLSGDHDVSAMAAAGDKNVKGPDFMRKTKAVRIARVEDGGETIYYMNIMARPNEAQIETILKNVPDYITVMIGAGDELIESFHTKKDRAKLMEFLSDPFEGGRLYQRGAEHEWTTKAKAILQPAERIGIGYAGFITADGAALAFKREPMKRRGSPFVTHYDIAEKVTGEVDNFDGFIEQTRMIRVDTAPNEVVFELFYRPTRDQIAQMLAQAKGRMVAIDLTHPGDLNSFQHAEFWGGDAEGIVGFVEERGRLFQAVAEMTPEQMREALLHDEMTGLRNRRAYDEDERLPYQLIADVEGLKFINDTYGHSPAGDQVIIAAARALREAAGEGNAYRGSDRGDEFIAQFRTREEAEAAGARLEQLMAEQQIEINQQAHQGLGISWGVGTDLKLADDQLNIKKSQAQKEGRRAMRGERPINLRLVGELAQAITPEAAGQPIPAAQPAPAPEAAPAAVPAPKPRSTYTPMISVSNLESVPSPLSGYVGNKRTMLQAGHYNEILTADRAGKFKRVVECFGGSGLLGNAFQRQLKIPRVYNELDPAVVAFHRQVKERPKEVIDVIQVQADQVGDIIKAYPQGGPDAYDAIQNFWKGMQFNLSRGTDVEKAALMAINNSGGLSIMGGGSQKIISGASTKEGAYAWRASKESFATVMDQLRRHGELLKAVEIHEGDARQRLAEATPDDLTLLDPPYVMRGIDDERVTGYNAGEDLLTLEGALTFIDRDMAEANRRGIPMIYTNNANPVIIEALKENGFHVRLVTVRSQNARGAEGGATYRDEVVAWNDPVGPADAGWRGASTEEVIRRVGSGRAEYLAHRARSKRVAAQHGPAEGMAPEPGAPVGGTPAAEPWGDAIDELNTESARPLLRQIREDYQQQLRGSRLRGVKGLNPEGQQAVGKYLRQVESDMASTKYAAMGYGEQMRDASLLNYNRRYGFDNYLGLAMPYQFWYTRSMMNWARRMIDRPSWFGMYARLQQMQEKQAKNMPTRLKGKSRIPAPWLPDWAGGGIWSDPWAKIFPFKQFGQPIEQLASDKNMIDRRAESILMEMVEAETISEGERQQALATRTGEAWEQARAQAQVDLDKNDSPASLVTNLVQPALWWTALDAVASGKPEKISPLPITRTAQAVRTATAGTPVAGLGRIAGLFAAPEEAIRKNAGLSQFGQWGDWTVDRMLSNMAADGTTSAAEAKRAMIERNPQDPIYAEAVRRVEYEQMLRVPGAATLQQAASGNLAGAVQSLPTLLFPGGLFPEGELRQRGLKAEYDAAWKRYKAGDDTAITRFFDENPEYEARLALYDDPEGRLQQFLVNEIWDGYYKLSRPNQQKARQLLGQRFEDSFMNKETRAYDAIPTEQLAMWSRMLKGMVPRTEETEAVTSLPEEAIPQPDYWSPEISAGIEAYQEERRRLHPSYYMLQEQYYNLPKGTARRSFLKRFPQLKEYWQWKADYKEQHPELAPYFEQPTVDETGASPQEVSQVSSPLARALLTYSLGGAQLSSGAKAELLRLAGQAGRSITPEEYARLLLAGMVTAQQ